MGAAVAAALGGDRPLVLADANISGAERVGSQLKRKAEWVKCDVTNPDDRDALAERVPALGSLVITAGLSPTMAPGERILEVNLIGMTQLLGRLDAAVGTGTAAVCFASIAGHGVEVSNEVAAILDDPLNPDLIDRLRAQGVDPSNAGTAYGLSKLGVIRLVRRLAQTWAPRGARILSLSPGIIDTPMGNQELQQQAGMQPMIDLVGRMGSAAELASVAAFLVSEGASFMNGCDVLVDGGFMALAEGWTAQG